MLPTFLPWTIFYLCVGKQSTFFRRYRVIISILMAELCDFPSLSESLDSFLLKNCFLAAYPNFLVIGYVLINNPDIVFLQNTYVKIPTIYYEHFFQALKEIGKYFCHNKEPESTTTTIFDADTYELQWCIEENIVYLKVNNHLLNKVKFEIDCIQYYFLVTGFKELFFKPYCFKYFVTYSFYCLTEVKTNTEEIQKLTSITDAVQCTTELQLNFNKEQLLLVSENIIRYKSELILYINLKNIVPAKPF